MIKTATQRSTTTMSGGVNKPKKETSPQAQFIGAALSMGWQLAVIVLVPIVGGYELDQRLKTTPLLTILGFVLAMAGTFLIVKKVLNEFNENVTPKGGK